jgi:hypothetical protein
MFSYRALVIRPSSGFLPFPHWVHRFSGFWARAALFVKKIRSCSVQHFASSNGEYGFIGVWAGNLRRHSNPFAFSKRRLMSLCPSGNFLNNCCEGLSFAAEVITHAKRRGLTNGAHDQFCCFQIPHALGEDAGAECGDRFFQIAEKQLPPVKRKKYRPRPFFREKPEDSLDFWAGRTGSNFHINNII